MRQDDTQLNDVVTDEVLEWLLQPGNAEAEAKLRRRFLPWVRRAVGACIRRWSLRGPDWQGGGLEEGVEEALQYGLLRRLYEQARHYREGGSRPRATPAFVHRIVAQFVVDECLGRPLVRRTAALPEAPPLRLVSLSQLSTEVPDPPAHARTCFAEVEVRVAAHNALTCLGEPAATVWRLYLHHLEHGRSKSEALRRIAPEVDLTPRQVESRLHATRPRLQALLEGWEIRGVRALRCWSVEALGNRSPRSNTSTPQHSNTLIRACSSAVRAGTL